MIETQRLILRKVQESDANDIFEYASDPDTGPRAGWPPHNTIEDTRQILAKWLEPNHFEKDLAIIYKQDNKVIGTIGIVHLNKHKKDENNFVANQLIEEGKNVFEIGTTISKKYWGKGISTESLKAVLDYLFEKENADVVLTLHYKENIASQKVQQKNNMQFLAEYERDKRWYNTDCTTMIVRGKTKDQWQAEK